LSDGAVDLEKDASNEKQPRGPRHRVTSRLPLVCHGSRFSLVSLWGGGGRSERLCE